MSPLWPDRLAVALYPERLAWLLLGWNGRLRDKGEAAFAPHPQAMIQALDSLLQGSARGTRLRLVLSNKLVRYACVQHPDAARSAAERAQLARHAFASTHGAAADTWAIQLSHGVLGANALASAIDRSLLDDLHRCTERHRLRLVALQPYLMAAFNAQARALPRHAGLFALAEPGRLCTLAWQDGGWAGVQQTHLEPGCTQVSGITARLRGKSGLPEQPVHVVAPEFTDFAADERAAVPLDWLPGLSPLLDRAWGGAMLGARR